MVLNQIYRYPSGCKNMPWAMRGDSCKQCGAHIGARAHPTGRMTPPFNTVEDDGVMFDGKHVCRKCYEKLLESRIKEMITLVKTRHPESRNGEYYKYIPFGSIGTLSIGECGSEYKTWKKKIEKEIKEMKV